LRELGVRPSLILFLSVFAVFSERSFAAEYCSKMIDPPVVSKGICGICPDVKLICDLKTKTRIPKVVFLGDRHAGSTLARQFKIRLLSLSRDGAFPVGSEGLLGTAFLPWYRLSGVKGDVTRGSAVLARGLESPTAHAVQMTYYLQNALVLEDQPRRPSFLLGELKTHIASLPLFQQAFERLKIKLLATVEPEMKSLIQEIDAEVLPFGLPEQQTLPPKMKAPLTSEADPEKRPVEAFATLLHLTLLDLANDPDGPYRCFLGNSPLHPLLTVKDRRLVGMDPDSKGWADGLVTQYDFYRVQMKVRDREFARAVAEMICDFSDSAYPGIFVMIGAEHNTPRFRSWLWEFTEGRLKTMEFFKTFDSNDGAEIEKLIREFGAGSLRR
jgi:hypothetical protein